MFVLNSVNLDPIGNFSCPSFILVLFFRCSPICRFSDSTSKVLDTCENINAVVDNLPPSSESSQPRRLRKIKKFYIATYGCQMNQSDSEIVKTILTNAGFRHVIHDYKADLILLNTCSVRENAEKTIWNKIESYRHLKRKRQQKLAIGILGCMAQRIQETFFSKSPELVDLIVGPDNYTELPKLIGKLLEQNTH